MAVSFVLPDFWEVISTARPAKDGGYLVETKRPAPFFLGKADGAHDDDNNLVSIAIEPGWPPAKELLAALRQQIRHRQKFGKRVGSRPLLAVFPSPKRPVPGKKCSLWRATIVGVDSRICAARDTACDSHRPQAMALNWLAWYFPAIANFSVALGPDRLIDYLAQRHFSDWSSRKREFLDAPRSRFVEHLGEVGESQPKPRPNARHHASQLRLPPRTRCADCCWISLCHSTEIPPCLWMLFSPTDFPPRPMTRSPKAIYVEDFAKSSRRSSSDRSLAE